MAAGARGTDSLDKAWSAWKPEFKTYTVQHNKAAWEDLKKNAAAGKR